jgi:hypothetical protein
MAHINYPDEYLLFSKLFRDIKAIHDVDFATPAGSVLTQYLTEQSIDLAADLILVTAADAAHDLFLQKDKLSEELKEKRDRLFNPAFKEHRPMVQFLKKLKRGKVHELGDWGVTVSNDDRIDYPSDFLTLRLAIKAFIDKHNTFVPPTSPLKPYLDENPQINIAQHLLDLGTALTHHTAFDQANKDAEEQRELRDTKFNLPYQHILGIGQFLMGLFASNPHKAGRYGFVIDEHTQVRRREITLAVGESKDFKKLDVGSKIEVTSEGEITITPITLLTSLQGSQAIANKNTPFSVKYGYGSSNIENTGSVAVTFIIWVH